MIGLALLALLFIPTRQILADEPKVMPITGHVQFWEKHCNEDGCEAPRALSDKLKIQGALAYPQDGNVTSWYKTTINAPESTLNLKILVLWKTASEPTFLVAQTDLFDGETPLASCNQYGTDKVPHFFAVGFCSIWKTPQHQIGVSFYKY